MRLHGALNPLNLPKTIRHLLEVAKGHEFIRRASLLPGHLQYCLKERSLINEVRTHEKLVKHSLGNTELVHDVLVRTQFITAALESQLFMQSCLKYRAALEPFLYARQCLENMNLEEGTLYLEAERELLRKAVIQANALPGPIIEVGTLYGYTTAWMAQWKKVDKKIVTVDNYSWNPWGLPPSSHKLFTSRLLGCLIHRGEVEIVDMDKNAFYESYRGPTPSLMFLDANHSYEETRKDIEWARRIGAKIIAGHDYCDVFGVPRAVEEAGGRIASADSVWVLNGSAWDQSNDIFLPVAA